MRPQVQGEDRGFESLPSRVSAPEAYPHALMNIAVRRVALDWTLFMRLMKRDGGQNLLVTFLGGAVLLNMVSSGARFGELARQLPAEHAAFVAGAIVLSTISAVFALAFAMGHVGTSRAVSSSLRLGGRGPAGLFAASLASAFAGRQALISGVALLPLAAYVNAWRGSHAALVAMAVGFVVNAAASSAAVVFSLLPLYARLASIPAAAAAAKFALPDIARLLRGDATPVAILIAIAIGIISIEACLAWRAEVVSRTAARTARFARAMLRGHALVIREMLYALRSPRLAGFFIVGAALAAFIATRLKPHGPLLPVMGTSLLPSVLFTAFYSNLFGPDRAGVQNYATLRIAIGDVLRAKVVPLRVLTLAILVGLWPWILPASGALRAFVVCATIAYAAALPALGYLTSVLFPRAVDARRISGDYLTPVSAFVTTVGGGLLMSVPLGITVLFDFNRISQTVLVASGVIFLVLAVAAHQFAARIATRLANHRREELTRSLS